MWIQAILAAVFLVGAACPTDPIGPPSAGPVTMEDIDYQIKITKDYIEKYKMQTYMFNQKAQNLMSRDFFGYRTAATMSDRSQAIVDDLTRHLQCLEEQKALLEKQGTSQTPAPSGRK